MASTATTGAIAGFCGTGVYCASGPKFCRAPFLTDPSSKCHKCSQCGIGIHVFCFGQDQEGGAKLCAQCIYPQGVSRDALTPPNIVLGQGASAAGTNIQDCGDRSSHNTVTLEYKGISHRIDGANEVNGLVHKCGYSARSKCLVRSREFSGSQGLYLCDADGCQKAMHPVCSFRMIHENKNGDFFFHESNCATGNERDKYTVLFCGKECYNKYKRVTEEKDKEEIKRANSGWTTDGVNGGKSSMDVLLSWLTDERNCDRYFGSKVSSSNTNHAEKTETKNDLCKEIVANIEKEVGNSNRTVHSVRTKIDGLISAFKLADEFAMHTGQGILANEGEERFKELVKQRCTYYFDLLPVMQDRHSIRAVFTNDDDSLFDALNDSDDEEQDEDHNSGGILNVSGEDLMNTSMESVTDRSMTSSSSKNKSLTTRNVEQWSTKAPALVAKQKSRVVTKAARNKDVASMALENFGVLSVGKPSSQHDIYIAKKSQMMDKRLKLYDDRMEMAQMKLNLEINRFAHEKQQSSERLKMEQMTFQLQHKHQIIQLNKDLFKQRLDFKMAYPNVTEEELDRVFPFHKQS